MARVKVTTGNIKQKLTQWVNATNLTDELVYHPSELNADEYISLAWNQGNIIIVVASDSPPFMKITYKEKLT